MPSILTYFVEYLLDSGVNILQCCKETDNTILHDLCGHGNMEAIQWLFEKGLGESLLNIENRNDRTAFLLALLCGTSHAWDR